VGNVIQGKLRRDGGGPANKTKIKNTQDTKQTLRRNNNTKFHPPKASTDAR